MTTWRDRLKNNPATFRGVAFFLEVNEFSGGRRAPAHEYPFRDLPSHDDLGLKARSFPVEAYVAGENYVADKERLISALEAPGPGELRLPLDRPRYVVVTELRVRESKDEGGMARLSITFEETAVGQKQPASVPDVTGALSTSVSSARDTLSAAFLAAYVLNPLNDSVIGQLRSLALKLQAIPTAIEMGTQERAQLARRVSDFSSSVESVITAPADLVANVTDLVGRLPSVSAVVAAYHFDPGTPPPSNAGTPLRKQELANFTATLAMVQGLAVVRAVEITAATTFSSYEDAVAGRDQVTDLLDEQAELTPNDDVFTALTQLRADLVNAVPPPGNTLAHLLPYTPPSTVPSLVLAHRLYGDVSREQDLVARNSIRHPGFVTGGQELEVLSDAG